MRQMGAKKVEREGVTMDEIAHRARWKTDTRTSAYIPSLGSHSSGLFTFSFSTSLDEFKKKEPDMPDHCKVVEVVTKTNAPMIIRIQAEHYWKVKSCI